MNWWSKDILVLDVNECEADPNPCQKANEECKNTQGHYSCECIDGYRRNFETDECELDIHGKKAIYLLDTPYPLSFPSFCTASDTKFLLFISFTLSSKHAFSRTLRWYMASWQDASNDCNFWSHGGCRVHRCLSSHKNSLCCFDLLQCRRGSDRTSNHPRIVFGRPPTAFQTLTLSKLSR